MYWVFDLYDLLIFNEKIEKKNVSCMSKWLCIKKNVS